ncbi:hypothetical protein CRE_08741 [Caenorhabditis remanei]|uniref:DUF19 domain-containing protein n=1 Tax=Caenorhabditis remanei TaxID=31234 RepID=E3LH99_CAERE|nr:hypothetical protein CRE_08741 [Caenorhabditis remanei]
MLKTLAVLVVLLSSVTCFFLSEKDICDVEKARWNQCFKGFINKTTELNEAAKEILESSSTVAPSHYENHKKHFKSLKQCVGDIHCKGMRKLIKFEWDTFDFYMEMDDGTAEQCVREADQTLPLHSCIHPKDYKFPAGYDFNKEILSCTKEVLENTECSAEDKKNVMRGALAVKDMYDIFSFHLKSEDLVNEFDLNFDRTKYL